MDAPQRELITKDELFAVILHMSAKIDEYEEALRQCAIHAGAEGTSLDDWRATTNKTQVALIEVSSLRERYDECLKEILTK